MKTGLDPDFDSAGIVPGACARTLNFPVLQSVAAGGKTAAEA
jgi:hypothetical protein